MRDSKAPGFRELTPSAPRTYRPLEPRLSLRARRVAACGVEVGVAARGWLAVCVLGLVLLVLLVR